MQKILDTPNMGKLGRVHSYWNHKSLNSKNSKLTSENENVNDISPEQIQKILQKYNVAGFEFGNWLSINDRYDFVIACEASLRDLASIIGSKNIGLNNSVGIAFGARGMSAAKAHYEPSTNMINLTKNSGANSLAHEWGHAFDYIIGGHVDQNKLQRSLTGGHSEASTIPSNTGGQLRAISNEIVDRVCLTRNAPRWKGYWHRRTEIFARSFEQYVSYKLKEKGSSNSFLAKPYSVYSTETVYIPDAEFKPIALLFDKLMSTFTSIESGKIKISATPYTQVKKSDSEDSKPTKQVAKKATVTSKKNTIARKTKSVKQKKASGQLKLF